MWARASLPVNVGIGSTWRFNAFIFRQASTLRTQGERQLPITLSFVGMSPIPLAAETREKPYTNPTHRPLGAADQPLVGTPASGRRFATIRPGMYSREVMDPIGTPTHLEDLCYRQGHFGSDSCRVACLCKGEGQLSFSGARVAALPHQRALAAVHPRMC